MRASRAQTLNENAVAELEPALAPGLGRALLLPTMAQLRNPRHLQALHQACLRSGKVQIDEGVDAQDFVRKGEHVSGVLTPAGLVDGDAFLITAGAWADELLALFGIRAGIKPIRGQIALLNPGGALFRRVLLWGARYLVPRLDGRVLVGSTEEDEPVS